jgi:hypothetical protein
MAILRRVLTTLVVVAAGVLVAVHPDAVKAFYEGIYPSDPAKREALELCFIQDQRFNRLDSAEREACYGRVIVPPIEVSSAAPARTNANEIDLQRAVGQGSLASNDIRRLEETRIVRAARH